MSNDMKEWRSRLGFTQEQAARRIGITTRNLQNYEAGLYEPTESIRNLMTSIETWKAWHTRLKHWRDERQSELAGYDNGTFRFFKDKVDVTKEVIADVKREIEQLENLIKEVEEKRLA